MSLGLRGENDMSIEMKWGGWMMSGKEGRYNMGEEIY